MKRRTTAAIAAATAAVTLGLAGCAGSPSPSESATADSGPLTVWIMGDSTTNFEQLVAPFTAQTGIEVDPVAVPWDGIDQKITTAVASGSGPDLLQIGLSKLSTYADAGALLDLTDSVAANPAIAPSNFPSGAASSVGGKQVSVPWISDTRVLFYRTDILQAAGITTPPATWDELRADAKTLAARGSGNYGYYIPQWDSPLPVEMTWSYGGDVVASDGTIDFDTPAFAKAVDTYLGLYADGSVPTNSDFDQQQGFISGVAPMLVSGPYLAAGIKSAAPELDGKWNVTTIPAGEPGDATSLFAGSNFGIWHNTAHKAAALELLSYLSDPATQVKWYQLNGDLPAATAALSDPSLAADPLVKVYSEQLAASKALPLVPNWDGETGKALLDALNAIALQGADKASTLSAFFAATKGTPAS